MALKGELPIETIIKIHCKGNPSWNVSEDVGRFQSAVITIWKDYKQKTNGKLKAVRLENRRCTEK